VVHALEARARRPSGAFVLLMTPVGLIAAVVFLGETLSSVQIVGGLV